MLKSKKQKAKRKKFIKRAEKALVKNINSVLDGLDEHFRAESKPWPLCVQSVFDGIHCTYRDLYDEFLFLLVKSGYKLKVIDGELLVTVKKKKKKT